MKTAEPEIKAAIEVLRSCAARGKKLNSESCNSESVHFFSGYVKACEDVATLIIDAFFKGMPLPVRGKMNNELPE